MKPSYKIIGLFQAAGLVLYVVFFVLSIQLFQRWSMLGDSASNPIFGGILVLLAFITSALICGSVAFVYPAMLFFENKKKEAVRIVIWTAIWLLILFSVFLGTGLFMTNRF
ncbi:MAG: hypothetical protein WC475_00110 [Candidatus Paceibacterota bacterium]